VSTADLMIGALAREIHDGDVLGVGLGTVLGLIAALAAKRTHAPGSEFTCAGALSPEVGLLDALRGPDGMAGRTGAWISHFDTMQMAERQAFTLMFLRPAQVDAAGALNVSRVGESRLPGGVGTADTPALLPRVVCYHTDHRPRSLPERVDFATGRGEHVATLVTDRCVVDYDAGRPRLRSIHPGQTREGVQAATGYALPSLEAAGATPAPSAALLAAIEDVDPLRLRDLEFRASREEAERRLRAALSRPEFTDAGWR
jgi:acyl CoA:acetate/3-ketoacid CoA transferase beta subunit